MKKPDWNILKEAECDSTNSYIKRLRVENGISDRTAIMTDFQVTGRGQSKNTWHSAKGKNLLVSLYKKIEISANNNFILTIITSLAINKALNNIGVAAKIKWPNDVYVNNKKIAGILIENTLMRNTLIDTILGIGLNVNEKDFPEWVPNPCSLLQITKKEHSTDDILANILEQIELLFDAFENDGGEDLHHEYNSLLYRLNKWHIYHCKDKEVNFNGRIHGVQPDGKLIIETDGGQLLHPVFGEISYIYQ